MSNPRRIAALASLLLLAACASGGGGPRQYWVKFRTDGNMSRHVVPYAPADVWRVLPRAYDDLGFPGGAPQNGAGMEYMTPQLGVRGQLYGKRNSEFIDCGASHGGIALEDQGEVLLAMITRLEPAPEGGTLVMTQVDSYARRREVMNDPVSCTSRGVLENAIAEILLMHLRGTPPPPRG